jgi:hypothetical protein
MREDGLVRRLPHGGHARDVALQVAFERQTLKLVFHLIGYRLWAMGQLNSTCRAPPSAARTGTSRGVAAQVEGYSLLIG